MKLIDTFIFTSAIILNLTLGVLNCFDNEYIILIRKYLPFLLTVIAFIRFLKDEYYEFNYFFYFILSTKVFTFFLTAFLENFTEIKNLFEALLAIFLALLLNSFIVAFLYQFFRKKSYKKELEKFKKLLEKNSLTQEEFDIKRAEISIL